MVTQVNLALSKVLAQLSSGIRYVAFVFLVYHGWHSSIAVGAALGIPSFAQLLFGPIGGLFADRYHRPRYIALMYLFQGLSVMGLFLLSEIRSFSAWALISTIYVLFFVINSVDVMVGPSYTTLITDMVGTKQLVRWQSAVGSLGQGAWIVGTVITGSLIQYVGINPLLFVIVVLSVLSSLFILYVRESRQRSVAVRTQQRRLGSAINLVSGFPEAWRALRSHPFLWAFMWVISITNIPHNILLALPLFLSMDTNAGYTGFGIVEASLMIGTILGNLWFLRKNQTYRIRSLISTAFIIQSIAIALLTFGTAQRWIVGVAILMAVYGSTDSLFGPAYSYLSVSAPSSVRGQVLGLFNTISVLLNPVMSVFTGWVLTKLSTLEILAALIVIFGLVSIFVRRLPALDQSI